MSVREKVSIKKEVAKEVGKGKGVVTIPVDAWVGLGKGLRKKFATQAVADAALSSDRGAKTHARQVISHNATVERSAIRGERIAQVISQSEQQQVSYLVSIDQTLKDMRAVIVRQNAELKRAQSVNAALQHRVEAKKQSLVVKKRPLPKPKDSPDVMDEVGGGLKDMLSMGNMLKYGAATVSTGYDVYQGVSKSSEWGVHPAVGGLASLFGGSGKGGMTQAVKKAVDLGTLGGLLKGPIGALVGVILGGVSGWIGGEDLAKFMTDLIKHVPSIIMDKMRANFDLNIKDLENLVSNKMEDTWTNLKDMGENLIIAIKKTFTTILAGFKDRVGDVFKSLGAAIPGLGFLGDVGAAWSNDAQKDRDNLDTEDQVTRKARQERRQERDTKRQNERDQQQKEYDEQKNKGTFEEITKGYVKEGKVRVPEALQPILGMPPGPEPIKAPPQSQAPSNIKSDLSVGEVSGDDIKIAASMASSMGDQSVQVPASALAAVVDKESSGIKSRISGDGGKSIGITQMGEAALEDVNKAFNTTFTQDQLKRDHKQSLMAAALFLKLKLQKNNGDVRASLSDYNGGSSKYSDDAMARIGAIPQESKVNLSPPEQKKTGNRLSTASVEVADAKQAPTATPAPPVMATNVTTVNNTRVTNAPIPTTHNDEPTLAGVFYRR